MKISQPMLFVGLGGTGCLIGAEFERRLRTELCGPDGTDLQDSMTGLNFLPYQLPSCLQFVYADLNEAELARMHGRVVPAEEHIPAATRTATLVGDLIPRHDTYPEVARSLRTNEGELTASWLPPQNGEPRVAPLIRGAGQLPTVGRAALFETFRHGLGPAQRPVADALGRISTSGGELSRLGGRLRASCDVFVAFSVAGGTGSGIFYDYLHLIGDALAASGYRAQIYPLVVMPSAFEEGMGGGRVARLNAGRALLDLFRLVDDQNGQSASTQLDDIGHSGALAVRYPGDRVIKLRPSTVQTAFLFSRPPGVERDDLHRSIVSLMLSLVGTELEDPTQPAQPSERTYQSFADDFINRGVEREVAAASGIGNRGVSTSLVASMTVPVDDLADIVSARLLASAVSELMVPPPGTAEVNRALIEQLFVGSNIEPLRSREALPFTEPEPARGGEAITRALQARLQTMEAGLTALERRLAEQMPKLVLDFDPRRGTEQLLAEYDIFRVQRVLAGHHQFTDRAERSGFLGLLESRRSVPPKPAGIEVGPPPLGRIRNPLVGRAHWTDEVPTATRQRQDEWYRWRSRRAWHAAWADQTQRWERKASALRRDVAAVIEAFVENSQAEPVRFGQRARDLYRPRVGVSYLLPPQGDDLEPFYRAVLRRFVEVNAARDLLRPTATEADIVKVVIGPEAWQQAFRVGVEHRPTAAVSFLRDRLKREVLRLFRHNEPGQRPLLPGLGDLLAAAAGKSVDAVSEEDLAQFRQKVAGLVPGGFLPQGSGRLKILISYPATGGKQPDVEKFLADDLNLPPTQETVSEFRPIEAESIVVVLFRTSMAVTEVREVREVLRHWSDAVRAAQQPDFLRWRQRLGFDFGYLVTTAEHRVAILHRLLCAMWNGQVAIPDDSSPQSPRAITIRLVSGGAAMTLPLTSYDGTSSWSSVIRAYEEWSIADDEQIRRDFSAQLMTTVPAGLESTPAPAASLYRTVLEVAEGEMVRIREASRRMPPESRPQAMSRYDFWAETLPAAVLQPFEGVNSPVRANLKELNEVGDW